ncbi:MAG TPA: sulfite exporter TauE/SafE family protein [Candidatus Binatus sp.]|nr:sulfite exporter TauE/SafE family protein [Candidatus Binatus sp.]
MDPVLVLGIAFFAASVLYASVGHAGASAYLAAMALVGLAPATMRPTALALNIFVATIVTVRFHLAGQVRWRAVAPFLLGSMPLAFIGGTLTLPSGTYKILAGLVLLVAAGRLFMTAGRAGAVEEPEPRLPTVPAVGVGAGIGLLSGLVGTGGGIFLTPFLLFVRWAGARAAAGMSSAFILGNSIAGLAGNVAAVQGLPPNLPLWLVCVSAGGLIGAEIGARRLGTVGLRRALAVVLVVASLKLIFLG